ncbi:hypothetical protein [Adhaeretor mobilis]|uniref:Uncharacterized protein n=1 Tax=Adhaeretor mobilis TaxID=1930276 RepID=A0A517MVP8_9BACT|nr:hypothetical protein [Adhaeretor mobilis]QDS98953.1 hypothetical protein HG15A2_22410 [Adhaeretor mobilis]
MRIGLLTLLCCAHLLFAHADCSAAELILSTLDGRELVGQLDERTDDQTAWVRSEAAGIALTSAVSWDAVVTVESEGQAVDLVTLREQHDAYVTAAKFDFSPGVSSASVDSVGADAISQRYRRAVGSRLLGENSGRARATSLQIIDVQLANLDRDAAPDGFLLSLALLDQYGQPVAVRGSLYAQLWTEHRPWNEARLTERERFRRDETWTQAVRPHEFVDGVMTVQLKFRHLEPQEEFDLLPDAELTIRLTAFGAGNFAMSTPVCVRPYDRYRDHRQHAVGDRYLPRELPGVIGRKNTSRTDGLWQAWP